MVLSFQKVGTPFGHNLKDVRDHLSVGRVPLTSLTLSIRRIRALNEKSPHVTKVQRGESDFKFYLTSAE